MLQVALFGGYNLNLTCVLEVFFVIIKNILRISIRVFYIDVRKRILSPECMRVDKCKYAVRQFQKTCIIY